MKKIYYYLAITLFLMWFLGYMVLNVGGAIHIVFLLGVVVLIYQLIKEFNKLT